MEKNQGKGLTFTRVFNAPRKLVWQAWTDPELLKQWHGPEGFAAPVIQMDLKVGGKYLYCMRGKPAPDAEEIDVWSTGVFVEIIPEEKLVIKDSFSNEHGEIVDPAEMGMSPDFPREMVSTVLFEDLGENKTKLTITYEQFKSEKEYEAAKSIGMDEGWDQSLDKLARVVER